MHPTSLVSTHPSTFLSLPRQKLADSVSGVSDSSTGNATSLRDAHVPRNGIASTSTQTVQLSAQFQSHSSKTLTVLLFIRSLISALPDLLDQDSEMQRAMGATDSFDSASTNQEPPRRSPYLPSTISTHHSFTPSASLPPAPQMTVSSLARPRSSLVRAGSLTETKLTANVLRRSEGPRTRKDSYDSSE